MLPAPAAVFKIVKRRIFAMIIAVVLVGLVLAPPGRSGARAYSQEWQQITAADNTFTVRIPPGWAVTSAVYRSFSAKNLALPGESVTFAAVDIIADPQSLQNCMRLAACGGSPFWSPRLGPVDVVRLLYARLLPNEFRQVQIVGAESVPAPYPAAFVSYQYVNPRGPMAGASLVVSLPVTPTPALNYWTFFSAGATAPAQYFGPRARLYAQVFQTLQGNQAELNGIAQGFAQHLLAATR